MPHQLLEAFEYCNSTRKNGSIRNDVVGFAIATSLRDYLSNLYNQLASINVDRSGVTSDQMISICDHLGLQRHCPYQSTYTHDEFCSFLIESMASAVGLVKINPRSLTIDKIADRMIPKQECQRRMLNALNGRLSKMKISNESPDSESVEVRLKEVQIENLLRELEQKNAKIETLERLATSLCKNLIAIDSSYLALRATQLQKQPKRNRTRSNSKNRREKLEETRNFDKKLDRIAVDLKGVKELLTRVQPSVENLERIAMEKTKVDEEKESERDVSPSQKGNSCLIQATMIDGVSDSGCLSEEDVPFSDEMTSSQVSEQAAKLLSSGQCQVTSEHNFCNRSDVNMAKNVRQRLHQVSKRLRDTESRLAQMNNAKFFQ